MDPARFVFLDETGTATNMMRRYGRSPSGARLIGAVPYGHWRTTAFVAGLRQTGIVAPLVLDGPMTGPAFCAYVEQFFWHRHSRPATSWCSTTSPRTGSTACARRSPRPAPRSSTCRPTARTSRLAPSTDHQRRCGAARRSSSCSPRLKAPLRKTAARTTDELWSAIGHLLETLPPAECINCLGHCGYRAT